MPVAGYQGNIEWNDDAEEAAVIVCTSGSGGAPKRLGAEVGVGSSIDSGPMKRQRAMMRALPLQFGHLPIASSVVISESFQHSMWNTCLHTIRNTLSLCSNSVRQMLQLRSSPSKSTFSVIKSGTIVAAASEGLPFPFPLRLASSLCC